MKRVFLARVVNLIVRNFLPKSRQLLFGRSDGTREKTTLWLAVFLLAPLVRGGVKEEER
jgi:hypothetical protein